MSIKEAKEDGIYYFYDPNRGKCGSRGAYVFRVPCDKCGAVVEVVNYGRGRKYICPECAKQRDRINRHKKTTGSKEERRFDQAVEKLRRQVPDMAPYKTAIALARTRFYEYGSVPEVLVAFELLRLGYRIIPQQKIKQYRADFVLPDERLVIEVDGGIFHKTNNFSDRDAIIQRTLGGDWLIIHIPAELIAEDVRKVKACIDVMIKNYRNHGT